MIFDFRHLLRLSVESRLTLSEQVGKFAAVSIAPWCEELSRAKELKGVWLVTHARQKCASEPLMHTHHTPLLRIIHYSVPWFIHMFISLSQNGTVPSLWSMFQISHQESLSLTSLPRPPWDLIKDQSLKKKNPQQVVYLTFEVLHWSLSWVFFNH